MEAGKLLLDPAPFALREHLGTTMKTLALRAHQKGLELAYAVHPAVPDRLCGDAGRLRQILVNLLGNAIKYTDAGSIVVKTRTMARQVALEQGLPQLVAAAQEAVDSWLAVQVIDSGRGIAAADQERVFEEFEQVDAGPRADSPHRGTGLGLAISRRLARLLGGDLLVESEPGKGSTFTLWLPVRELQSGTS